MTANLLLFALAAPGVQAGYVKPAWASTLPDACPLSKASVASSRDEWYVTLRGTSGGNGMACDSSKSSNDPKKCIKNVYCDAGQSCTDVFSNDANAQKLLWSVEDPSLSTGTAQYWLKGGLPGLWNTTRTDAEDCKGEVQCEPKACSASGKNCVGAIVGKREGMSGGDGFRFTGLLDASWNNGIDADPPVMTVEVVSPPPFDNDGSLNERVSMMVHPGNTVPVSCGDLYSENVTSGLKNASTDWESQRDCVLAYWVGLCTSSPCGMTLGDNSMRYGSWSTYKGGGDCQAWVV